MPSRTSEASAASSASRSRTSVVRATITYRSSPNPAASVLSVHADWTVADPARFRASADAALDLAEREDVLVTVGARATRPEVGYGYIVPGERMGAGPARRIARFVEKPAAAEAERLIAGGALWNTGMFAWTAGRFRAECERHAPELAGGLPALDRGDVAAFYRAVKPVSVDVALYERTDRGAVLAGDFGWDDVGSWAALSRVRAADAAGNVVAGTAYAVDATNCVVWSEEGATVVEGVTDLVVVRSRGVTLVTTRARAPYLKELLSRLPAGLVGEGGADGGERR